MISKNIKIANFEEKKGFTLIELLAVIVILAVIALIAVPISLNVIESSRKETFRETVRRVFDSYELYKASNSFNPEKDKLAVTDPDLALKSNLKSGTVYSVEKKTEVNNVTDGVYCAKGLKPTFTVVKGSCTLLDDTPATVKLNMGLITASTIKVSVEATDIESGISGYQYSLDGGKTYTKTSTNNVYEFKGLKHNTEYSIKVKVINGNKLETYTDTMTVKTLVIEPSTYIVDKTGWQQQKIVTITYPSITGQTLTYEYSTDKGATWQSATDVQKVTFTANGTVIARVSDGTNTVTANVFTVDQIDRIAPTMSLAGNTDAWTTNKTLTVTASDNGALAASAYSFDNGATWQASNAKTITSNGTYVVKVKDQAGNISTQSVVVSKISLTTPTITITKSSVGSNYVTIKATVTDNEMGTAKIEFSKDNGTTYVSSGTNTIYIFSSLDKNTSYTFKARVTSKNGKVGISNTVTINTSDITIPTYIVDKTGWQQQKIVTITYPSITGQTLTYEYSTDKGATWKTAVQGQKVTFTANGTVIARVSDGTNTVTANVFTVDQIDRIAPTMSVAGNTDAWTTNKTLTVTASDNGALAASAYSFDNGATWQASNAKTITSNGTYVVKVKDQAGNISTQSVVVSKISVTAPTITISKVASGSNYVTIKATVTDNEMGTAKIEFSKDNGTTYVSSGTNETYTFLGLTNNTSYNFKARVTSKNGKVGISSVLSVTTSSLSAPTYVVDKTGWQQQKIVTINYPSITGQTLTYEYSTDKGTTWKTAVQGQKVTYTANGTVIGRVSDGTNVITASVFTVNQIDRTAPVIKVNGSTANSSVSVGAKSGSYSAPAANITDNSGVSITPAITNNVRLGTIGTYTVTYKATDPAGNSTTLVLTVRVVAPTYTGWMTSTEYANAGYSTSASYTSTKTQYKLTYTYTSSSTSSIGPCGWSGSNLCGEGKDCNGYGNCECKWNACGTGGCYWKCYKTTTSTNTGTTPWQDSSTTNLGTVTRRETRTLYRAQTN